MGKLSLILTLLVIMPMITINARTQTETLLYTFTGGSDGGVPYAGLLADGQDNLYGTAQQYGGNACEFSLTGCGTLFELTPNGGEWTFNLLYTFKGGDDGWYPSSPLVSDADGNLYGTTTYGGNAQTAGSGTIFRLKPTASGWEESVLYTFTGGMDGGWPTAGLAIDRPSSTNPESFTA